MEKTPNKMDNLIIRETLSYHQIEALQQPLVHQKDAMNLPPTKLFNIPGAIHQLSRNN